MRAILFIFTIIISLFPNLPSVAGAPPTNWGEAQSLAWSPDGKYLVVCSVKGLWFFDTTAFDQPPRYFWALCGDIIFSADGKRVATLPGWASSTKVGIWNVETVQEETVFVPSNATCGKDVNSIGDIAFDPDNIHIAVIETCIIEIWDIKSGVRQTMKRPHIGDGAGLAYSPDGTMLAIFGNWGFELWNVAQKKLVFNNSDRGGWLQFSPDGKQFAIFDSESIKLWSVGQKEKRATLTTQLDPLLRENYLSDVKFSDDNLSLTAIGHKAIVQWNLRTYKYQPKAVFYDYVPARNNWPWGLWNSQINPQGTLVANIGVEPVGVFIWDAQTGKLSRQVGKFVPCVWLC